MYLWDDIENVEHIITNHTLLLMLDFDGTLSPIAPTPDKAILPKKTKKILEEILKKTNIFLSIVSDRQLAILKEKVKIPHMLYIGNHGFEEEIFGKKKMFFPKEKIIYVEELKTMLQKVSKKFPGSFVEDKDYIVTFHYRLIATADIEKLKQKIHAVAQNFSQTLFLVKGKKAFEFSPNNNIHKGTSVEKLIKETQKQTKKQIFPIYIGDDNTDEDAFYALQNGITLRVGKMDKTYAKYFVKNTNDVANFLQWILHHAK